jgi:hypothetical protein
VRFAAEARNSTPPIPAIITPQNANASRPIHGFGIVIKSKMNPP